MKPTTIILLVSIGIIMVLASGCLAVPGSTPPEPGSIVSCSKFSQVIDKYETAEHQYYIVLANGETKLVDGRFYKSVIHTGQFVQVTGSFWNPINNLTSLNESESGYRDACRVMP
ncbi:MAG: hypothetical protein M0Q91_13800 [Methanoregula sp.]|jgi:hypothetical protein|nr:hypothetical protein [Methanoregula sp.]